MSLAKTSVEQVVGVAAPGLRVMICSMDGEIETPAGTGTVVDVMLDCRNDATTSTPPVSGHKQNVEHLAGTSCIAPPSCGFQATSSLMREWESSTVDLIDSIVATIIVVMLFISATKSSIASTLFSQIGTWL
jgi:hypothetical protein